eukprot:3081924-Rhodomonas_salina.2
MALCVPKSFLNVEQSYTGYRKGPKFPFPPISPPTPSSRSARYHYAARNCCRVTGRNSYRVTLNGSIHFRFTITVNITQ